MLRELLAVLTGEDYAECFKQICGHYPKWVPKSGIYGERRIWISYRA